MLVKKIIILVVSVLLTAGIVITGVMALRLKQAMADPVSVFFAEDIEVTKVESEERKTSNFEKIDLVRNQKSYIKKDKILTVAVLGRDATPVEEYRSDGGNTDIMIIIAIDFNTNNVQAISIPRDTVAHLYHYNRRQVQDDEFFDKLNSAYSAGGAENEHEFQLANSVVCIQEYLNTFGTFDITIDNYVELGLTGLREITDRVGGVDVTLNNGMPGIGSTGQTVHLDGDMAMYYVRDRHNSGGDLGRVSNAQVYVKAMAKTLQNMGVEQAVSAILGPLIQGNLIRTDLTLEEITSLATMLIDIDVDALEMQTVESIEVNNLDGFKEHLSQYPYDFENFYKGGEWEWDDLDIKKGDEYDSGVFSEYYSLEEIMLNTYYIDAATVDDEEEKE